MEFHQFTRGNRAKATKEYTMPVPTLDRPTGCGSTSTTISPTRPAPTIRPTNGSIAAEHVLLGVQRTT